MEFLVALGIAIALVIVAGVVVTTLTGNPFLGFLASLLMIWGTWYYWGPIHAFAARIWGGVPPIGAQVVPTTEISVNPTTIDRGQSATLTWRTDHAENVTLNGENVDRSGNRNVSADQTMTYRLIARGPGGTREASATLNVRPASPGPAPTTNPGPVAPTPAITPTVTTPPAVATPSPAGSYRTPYGHTTQPSSIHAVRTLVGSNIWKGRQLDLASLPALGNNEWYSAYGDVLGNGSCAVKVFKSGKPSGLSAATWQLYKVTGPSDEARNDELAVQQEIAAREAGTCPMAP